MKILALDTTGDVLSLALGGPTRSWSLSCSGPHDERLIPAVERLLKRAAWKLKDVDAVAVANGPGRFTGIRIGMTFASVLGKVLRRPTLAVSHFDALAHGFSGPSGRPVCVVLPARAGSADEFFLQTFAGKGGRLRPLGEALWTRAAQLPAAWSRLPRGSRLYGPAAEQAARIIGGGVETAPGGSPVSAEDLIAPARERLAGKKSGAFLPLYLKPANFQKRPLS